MSFTPTPYNGAESGETIRALVQHAVGEDLKLTKVPIPTLLPGSAIVQVLAIPVASYAKQIYNGERAFPYATPLVPGPSCIARVAQLPADSTELAIGDLVYVDIVVRSRDDPKIMFLFGTMQGGTQGGAKLMGEAWRDGTMTEMARVPLENVYKLDEKKLLGGLGYSLQDLSSVLRYLVPYGGLSDIDVKVGETVVVCPATGGFGGAAVAVAVAMGAEVIAMGRNTDALKALEKQFGAKTVRITGDEPGDAQAIKDAAGRPVDAVLEISPPMAFNSPHIRSAIKSLRRGGRVSLMGGMQEDYAFPFGTVMHNDIMLKGKWMYGREEILRLIRMVENGRLNIGSKGGLEVIGHFDLADWKEAFDVASAKATWDGCVVMTPKR